MMPPDTARVQAHLSGPEPRVSITTVPNRRTFEHNIAPLKDLVQRLLKYPPSSMRLGLRDGRTTKNLL